MSEPLVYGIWYFFIYAFLGWCVEVVFHTITTGKWVNRGFLNGPVCPIYGVGMVLVLLALWPLRHNLFVLFLGSVVLTSTLELITGWVLKTLFHTTWWDYSDEPFQLGGYICLRFSLAWGVGGVFMVRIIHPVVHQLVHAIPVWVSAVLLSLFSLVFVLDFSATCATLAGFAQNLRELEAIAQHIHKASDQLSHGLSDATLATDKRVEEQLEKLPQTIAELEMRRDFLQASLVDGRLFGSGRLLRAFPRIKSGRYAMALEQLREQLWHRN